MKSTIDIIVLIVFTGLLFVMVVSIHKNKMFQNEEKEKKEEEKEEES